MSRSWRSRARASSRPTPTPTPACSSSSAAAAGSRSVRSGSRIRHGEAVVWPAGVPAWRLDRRLGDARDRGRAAARAAAGPGGDCPPDRPPAEPARGSLAERIPDPSDARRVRRGALVGPRVSCPGLKPEAAERPHPVAGRPRPDVVASAGPPFHRGNECSLAPAAARPCPCCSRSSSGSPSWALRSWCGPRPRVSGPRSRSRPSSRSSGAACPPRLHDQRDLGPGGPGGRGPRRGWAVERARGRPGARPGRPRYG